MTIRLVLAAAAGVVLSVALPPYGVWPALLALVPLFVLVSGSDTAREAFWLGAAFAAPFFALYVLWLPQSFSQPDFLGPAFWLFYPPLLAILAAFWGIVTGLARLLGGRGPGTLRLLPGLWVLMEWARAQGYFGFPWGTLGYLWLDTPVAQVADAVGVYGLSLLATAVAALVAAPFVPRGRRGRGRSRFGPVLAPGLAVVLLGVAWGAGLAKLARPVPEPTDTALLVQGNIDPFDRARGSAEDEIGTYVRLTSGAIADLAADLAARSPTYVIWPEGAVGGAPLADARGLMNREALRTSAPDSTLIVGAGVFDRGRVFNSVYSLDDGLVLDRYDKRILVPFGERWPLIEVAAPVYRAVFAMLNLPPLLGTTPGAAFTPLATPEGPVAVYVCYESVFPQVQRAMVRRGARLLVTVTNDAWFARGNGARQHWAMGRLRAIETRRYLLRAANDGITGAVDPQGRTLAELERRVEGTLVVPFAFSDVATPYVRYGGLFVPALAGAVLVMALVGLAGRR